MSDQIENLVYSPAYRTYHCSLISCFSSYEIHCGCGGGGGGEGKVKNKLNTAEKHKVELG